MKVQINPVQYRSGFGTFVEVIELKGNPPLTVNWVITTDLGSVLETGSVEMSQDQWTNWPAGEDNNYIEHVTAALIGVTIA